MKNQKIKIKYLANHYYLPMIVSETEKIDYLNHIINVDSEVRFIEQLEEYLAKPDSIFSQFDSWMFSKLDPPLDEVFIPYTIRGTIRLIIISTLFGSKRRAIYDFICGSKRHKLCNISTQGRWLQKDF